MEFQARSKVGNSPGGRDEEIMNKFKEIIIALIISLIIIVWLYLSCRLGDRIEKDGLRSIVMEIWEGKK